MTNTVFVTALNCIDGRVQIPAIEFIKQKTQADYVDMITEAGIVKHLAGGGSEDVVGATRKSVEISVSGHHSKHIFIVAHSDCLGNPVSEEMQKSNLLDAKGIVEAWSLPVKVSGLWVNNHWEVEEV